MRVRVLIAAVALPLVLWAILPLASSGQSKQQELSELQSKIAKARAKIGRKKGAERTLSSQIAGYQRRIDRLQGKITTLADRQDIIEIDLNAKRTELERLQTDLRAERARLVRLRKRFTETRTMLRVRLVEIYKAGKPDLVTVILNSDGFADLLERSEFIARISDQDRKIVTLVTAAKGDATRSEKRLARLEDRQQRVTEIVQKRRDEVADIKMELIGTRVGAARTKADKAAALTKVRSDRASLESHVEGLEKASNRIARQLNIAQQGNAGDLPIRQGSGSMIWPINARDLVAVRLPLGAPARGDRPAGERGHADPRRRQRQGRAHAGRRLVGRLRQLHLHPAHRLAVDVLRAPGALRDEHGRPRRQGPDHGLRRQHRPLVRRSPALRDARQRHARQPAELPVARGRAAPGR